MPFAIMPFDTGTLDTMLVNSELFNTILSIIELSNTKHFNSVLSFYGIVGYSSG